MHEQWYVFPRRLPPSNRYPAGRIVFYYNVYLSPGKRSTAWSTGIAARSDKPEDIERARLTATKHVTRLETAGKLIPEHDVAARPKYRTFSELARGFWLPASDYCRSQKSFGKPVTESYAKAARGIVDQHLRPTFGRQLLEKITPDDVERFGLRLFNDGAGLSAARVNNILSVFRVMLGHAYRARCLSWNPREKGAVRPFKGDKGKRGHLTLDEFRRLFDPAVTESAWNGNIVYRLANLTAAVCGLRQGEILAIRADDVHDGHLTIDKSYIQKTGKLGPTKAARKTPVVPIPGWLRDELQPLLDMSRGRFVFSQSHGKKPAAANRLTLALYSALEAIGIPDAERQERGIVFHSWRHYFNSYARAAGITDTMVRLVTGHSSSEMTENYTSLTLDQLEPVAAMQRAMVPNGSTE